VANEQEIGLYREMKNEALSGRGLGLDLLLLSGQGS
jgi:hypothetical protein